MSLPWLSELTCLGEGMPGGARVETSSTPLGILCYACCGPWDCSLAAAERGKHLERQPGEQAPASSAALGSLAGRGKVQACPQRAVNRGLGWAVTPGAVDARDGDCLAC